MDQATKDAFAKLTQTVERGFAAVAEDIADIRARMATTKDDLAAVRDNSAPKCGTVLPRSAKNSATFASVSKRSKRPRVIRLG
jgi:hypothetical protein